MNSTDTRDYASGGEFTDELKAGATLLQGQYVIDGFLNSGGFGITYLAKDSLDRTVVIKECFPASFCCRSDNVVRARSRAHQKDFRSIVRLFVQEARRLSKLSHPNIVGVHQVFEDNDTAYMALDYIDGQDLLDILEEDKMHLGQHELRNILLKILDAIGFMHDQNILHRDISPDNILLDRSGDPILIDFGAAREKATKASRALSALLVVKDGYSPQEFYIAGSKQGPSSDLYALAATFYHMVVGEAPPNSQTRLAAIAAKEEDPYQSIITQATGFDHEFLAAIDKALNLFPKDRIQTAEDWAVEIDLDKRRASALAKARKDKNIEWSISKLVTETNQAVLKDKQQHDRELKAEQRAPVAVAPNPVAAELENAINHLQSEGAPEDGPEISGGEQSSEIDQPVPEPNLADETTTPRRRFFSRPAGQRPARRFWIFGKSRTENLGKAGL